MGGGGGCFVVWVGSTAVDLCDALASATVWACVWGVFLVSSRERGVFHTNQRPIDAKVDQAGVWRVSALLLV